MLLLILVAVVVVVDKLKDNLQMKKVAIVVP